MRDHALEGRAVLPAVETLLILAARACEDFPQMTESGVRHMSEARFVRFLEIPETVGALEVLVSCRAGKPGTVRAVLSSRIRLKAMSRLLVHGEVLFGGTTTTKAGEEYAPEPAGAQVIPVEELYSRMVPFGPAYRTLQGELLLEENRAWGRLRAPEHGKGRPEERLLGSPFPLDGAMHAACVLGQQHVDYVPFPVGFDTRTIFRPTRAEERYSTLVRMRDCAPGELVFDLWIRDRKNNLCELVSGLRMRDVLKQSAGKGGRARIRFRAPDDPDRKPEVFPR
jgi:hypothetical protein